MLTGAMNHADSGTIDVVVLDRLAPHALEAASALFAVHVLADAPDREALLARVGARARALARGGHSTIDRALIERLPRLEIIAGFGVGYDGIDLTAAAERGIVVTNTPDVLTEETADTALGLLLMTVRELSAAERHLRAGKWVSEGPYPLSASLRDRTVGMVGLGRIGMAIARRLDAMKVPVVYHTRQPRPDVPYRHYADVRQMAADVDVLLAIVPGTPATRGMIDARVLEALGPDGIFINVGRGSVVDEPALIAALRNGTIRAAGLDVFANEPHVPAELLALPNAVLLPHVGSASVHTRRAMGQLVVDNLRSWFEHGRPLTPVPETPWPRPGGQSRGAAPASGPNSIRP
jgi:lactate dehydrogenase-like 2-hydroxyacid dehydrogenase